MSLHSREYTKSYIYVCDMLEAYNAKEKKHRAQSESKGYRTNLVCLCIRNTHSISKLLQMYWYDSIG